MKSSPSALPRSAFRFILALFCSNWISLASAEVRITEGHDEGMECFIIQTSTATYFYQKEAGGFSSILDIDGNDWLSYRKSEQESYPASAASDYRGLPNRFRVRFLEIAVESIDAHMELAQALSN